MISNPIYAEFIKLGLINNNHVKKISNQTRDTKIPVYIDSESKIIFLESFDTTNNHYDERSASGDPEDPFGVSSSVSASFIEHGYYPDDLRRFNQFKSYLKVAKHVLDFGCEWGGFVNLARKHCDTVSGIELNDSCLEYLNKTFEDASFYKKITKVKDKPDLITSFHVLEHMPNQLEMLNQFKQVLANNGTLIIEVPHSEDFLIQTIDLPEFREFTFWSEHLVLHTKTSLEFVLKEAGFSSAKVFGFQRFGYTNHLGWVKDKKPDGHVRYAYLEDESLDLEYKKCRIRTQTTDTLIAVAKK